MAHNVKEQRHDCISFQSARDEKDGSGAQGIENLHFRSLNVFLLLNSLTVAIVILSFPDRDRASMVTIVFLDSF